MKVLVVGGGGREHAIAQALSMDTSCTLFSVMSRMNPGIAVLSSEVLIAKETDVSRILPFCQKHQITHAFIGPEAPLEAGLVDALSSEGIRCVGPSQAAARIETNKAYCRELMHKHSIPGLPEYHIFSQGEQAAAFLKSTTQEFAIKPIGLTGGKGVRIMGEHLTHDEAISYVRELGGDVVIEERLEGEEFTLQAFVDGSHIAPMPLVQDHKRAFEGDCGPNTGGMGAYTMEDHRLPFVSDKDFNKALEIMHQVVDAMDREGNPYIGILYGQFMNTATGPMVIEFNARFGDPEAMNVLSLLKTNLTSIVTAITSGTLDQILIEFEQKATVCKYLVPEGYPDEPKAGQKIKTGTSEGALLYFASVVQEGSDLITQSSRTMAYVGIGDSLADAQKMAESAAMNVTGPVMHRRDIGTMELLGKRMQHMQDLR